MPQNRPSATVFEPPRPVRATAAVLRIEWFLAKSDAEFLGVLCIGEAADDPPPILVEDAVRPLANRQVDAKRIYQPAVRTSALVRRDRNLMWPAAID